MNDHDTLLKSTEAETRNAGAMALLRGASEAKPEEAEIHRDRSDEPDPEEALTRAMAIQNLCDAKEAVAKSEGCPVAAAKAMADAQNAQSQADTIRVKPQGKVTRRDAKQVGDLKNKIGSLSQIDAAVASEHAHIVAAEKEEQAQAKPSTAKAAAKAAAKPFVAKLPAHPHAVSREAEEAEEEERRRRKKQPIMTRIAQADQAAVRFVERGVVAVVAATQVRAVRKATYHAAHAVHILDDHAMDTASKLEDGLAKADTVEEKKYYQQEIVDAGVRRVGGRTFIGQEIDNRNASAIDREFGAQLGGLDKHLSTYDIMRALEKIGAVEKGYNFFDRLGGQNNAEWSDRNVKRLDLDGDGQLSDKELLNALRKGEGAAKETAHNRAERALDNAAAKTEIGKQLDKTLWKFNADKKTYDLDHDGKVELHEVVGVLKGKGITQIKDVNGDHQIGASDAMAMVAGIAAKKPAAAASHAPAKGHK
jgi:hypothetical protein